MRTKTTKTLFESLGTLCLCSVIVMNLVVSKLPPFPCQYHNISFRYQSFQKEKPRFAKKQAKEWLLVIGYWLSNTLNKNVIVPVKKVFLVFPLEMSYVAKQRVMMAGLVCELAHRHRAMTSALMLEEQRHRKRGF